MSNAIARPTPCYRCGTIENFPILVRVIESGSGPGAMLYACSEHARRDYEAHFTWCPTCRTGERCETSRSMRELILAAREARLASLPVSEPVSAVRDSLVDEAPCDEADRASGA